MKKIGLLLAVSIFTQITFASSSNTSLIKQTGFRQYSTEQGLSQNTITHIFQDSKEFIWLATAAGLNKLNGKSIELIKGPDNVFASNNIIQIWQDSEQSMWVSTFEGLVKLDNDLQQGDIYKLPAASKYRFEKNFAVNMFEISSGVFWVASWEGVFKLSVKGREIQTYPSMDLLREDKVYVRQALKQGNLIWLETNKGIYRFNTVDNTLLKVKISPQIDNAIIEKLFLINQSQMLVMTRHSLHMVELDSPSPESTLIYQSNQAFSDIVRFEDRIFVSISDQLHQFNPSDKSLTHLFSLSELLPKYTSYQINELFIDINQKLWIGTDSQGAYLWDPNSLTFQSIISKTRKPELKLENNTVWTFVEDENENYWIGTDAGLSYLSIKSATLSNYLGLDHEGINDAQSRIFSIIEEDQKLWLATADGLLLFDPVEDSVEVFKPASLLNQQIDFFIYDMTETPDGAIWLATDMGPKRFLKNLQIFDNDHPLINQEKENISSFIQYQDDHLWLGFENRLLSFDVKTGEIQTNFEISHRSKSTELFLTDFYLEGSTLWTSFSGEGIYVTDSNTSQVIKHLTPRTGFVDGIVYSLIPRGEHLWASTHSGLVRINRNDFSFRVFSFYDGLPSNEFNEGASYVNSDGELMFGGTNGILFFAPKEVVSQIRIKKPIITQVRLQDKLLKVDNRDWSNRSLKLLEGESLIQIKLSVLDYLTPQKWKFEYWLDGSSSVAPRKIEGDEITLAQLAAGDYQLHVRAYFPGEDLYSEATTLRFTIESPIWTSPAASQISYALLVILLACFFWWYSRKKRQVESLANSITEKQQKLDLFLVDNRRGIWEWATNDGTLVNSKITITLTEQEKVELAIDQYISNIHPDDISTIRQAWENFLQSGNGDFDEVYRVFFFEIWVWTKVYGKVTEYDNRGLPAKAAGTWLDISDDKKSMEKLKLYKHAIQSTQDVVIIADGNLKILSVNGAYALMTGFLPDDLVGRNLLKVGKEKLSYQLVKNLNRMLTQNNSWQGELNMPRKNGTSYPVKVSIDVIEGESEKQSYIIVASDI
ncbi:MAG: PAS domain S-box protein, partial [Kangiellaceae bacterium]|nr:PAS domain S-box protein [Kangiellaceae bacterium]